MSVLRERAKPLFNGGPLVAENLARGYWDLPTLRSFKAPEAPAPAGQGNGSREPAADAGEQSGGAGYRRPNKVFEEERRRREEAEVARREAEHQAILRHIAAELVATANSEKASRRSLRIEERKTFQKLRKLEALSEPTKENKLRKKRKVRLARIRAKEAELRAARAESPTRALATSVPAGSLVLGEAVGETSAGASPRLTANDGSMLQTEPSATFGGSPRKLGVSSSLPYGTESEQKPQQVADDDDTSVSSESVVVSEDDYGPLDAGAAGTDDDDDGKAQRPRGCCGCLPCCSKDSDDDESDPPRPPRVLPPSWLNAGDGWVTQFFSDLESFDPSAEHPGVHRCELKTDGRLCTFAVTGGEKVVAGRLWVPKAKAPARMLEHIEARHSDFLSLKPNQRNWATAADGGKPSSGLLDGIFCGPCQMMRQTAAFHGYSNASTGRADCCHATFCCCCRAYTLRSAAVGIHDIDEGRLATCFMAFCCTPCSIRDVHNELALDDLWPGGECERMAPLGLTYTEVKRKAKPKRGKAPASCCSMS